MRAKQGDPTIIVRSCFWPSPKKDAAVDDEETPRTEPLPAGEDVSLSPPAAGPPQLPANPARLFSLLRAAYVGEKSGHLHCTAGGSCRSLRMVSGQIRYGTSDVDGEHLGDVDLLHARQGRQAD